MQPLDIICAAADFLGLGNDIHGARGLVDNGCAHNAYFGNNVFREDIGTRHRVDPVVGVDEADMPKGN